jgi:Flp pilus assembly protein protease CpaA
VGLIFTDAEDPSSYRQNDLAGTCPGIAVQLVFGQRSTFANAVRLIYQPAASASSPWLSLLQALMGAAAGASFIYGAGAIYLRARGVEGMGFGDVKLMAMVGAFLGIRLTIFTLFSASVVGSLAGLSTVLVVWIKRTRAAGSVIMNRRAWPAPWVGVGQHCPAALSHAVRRISRQHAMLASFLATSFFAGTGGCCEAASAIPS